MQTDHNLCLNLCFDQSLTFAIQGTYVESRERCFLSFQLSVGQRKILSPHEESNFRPLDSVLQ